ncbi:hypothetical protein [Maliponia aquimaris]|uniref:Uncharacterized protein n=1 Tax=Maliponia aquimaris TaxID=1673631 RepID=A0A238KM18_9RHOB|nr:hypothetical protein [Maliponia aquimaris]SMX43919.1 hypothetical protein MAA8898_02935 [Maliponia aquimaris]
MYHKFAIAALVLGLAGPAFANDGLARTIGVEPGKYTTSELVQIMFADDKKAEMKAVERRRAEERKRLQFLGVTSTSN